MEANNMEAMRKTLEEMAIDLEDLASSDAMRAPAYSSIFSIFAEKCRKSLAAPPRNCDVGTAEEQYERYRKRCGAQDCCDCPVRARWDFKQTGSESCQLVWAQMPYEEGEADGAAT